MTKEMATAMIKNYTKYAELANKAYDDGDLEEFGKWLDCANALRTVVEELGYTFRKSWDGQYVIVER